MKKCKNCDAEFQPKHETRGHEQLYCGKKCQLIAARIRREERLKNIYEKKEVPLQSEANNSTSSKDSNLDERKMGGVGTGGRGFPNYGMANTENLYDKYYEAKIEGVQYKLENQMLRKELELKERVIIELESEIDELENETENEGGIMGSVMDGFKKDPATAVTMVTSLLDHYFKPKK
jgi:hypothetical protein